MLKLLLHYFSCIYWARQSVGRVRKMQLRKFRKMFEYARAHSAFYRELYKEAGVLDLDVRSWDDVEKIPIVTKDMMRKALTDDILTSPFDEKKHNWLSTSGSSGNPFKIVYDKWVSYTSHVRFVVALMRGGYTPFKKITWVGRHTDKSKFSVEEDNKLLKRLQTRIGIFRRNLISVFTPIDEMIAKIKEQNPFVLWISVSAAHLLALELERRHEQLHIPLLVIYAETHTSRQVDLFKERISPNVMDVYGSEEFPSMSMSLNQEDVKRVFSNFVMYEVKNEREVMGRKVGDLVVTNLLNKAMPFIRYDLGDFVGVLDDKNFPSRYTGSVYGRFDDVIHLPDGGDVYFHRVYHLFTDFGYADQYKVYQRKNGHLEFWMRLKAGSDANEAIAEARKRWTNGWPGIEVDFLLKEDMPIDPRTGKFKVIEKER